MNLARQSVDTDNETLLSESQCSELLKELFGWEVDETGDLPHLKATFKFKNFAEALQFTNHVGELAEQVDHHPRLTTEWGRTTVEWASHSAGGLTQNDFVMAAKTSQVYENWERISGKQDQLDEALQESFPASDPPSIK